MRVVSDIVDGMFGFPSKRPDVAPVIPSAPPDLSGVHAGALPAFLQKEATEIVEARKRFHIEKRYVYHGLLHFSTFAGYFFPLANIIIPYLVWQLRRDMANDTLCIDARDVCNFQITLSIYFLVFLAIVLVCSLVTFPFLMAISGARRQEDAFGITEVVTSVILPSIVLYQGMWCYLSIKAANQRFMGLPHVYLLAHAYIG